MLLYVTVGTNDLARAGAFYDRVLCELGYMRRETEADSLGYAHAGDTRCRFWVTRPYDQKPASFGNGVTIALMADSRDAVRRFHAAALAQGGLDEGEPGLRPFHDHFYAAFARDLDGNKIAAVCERPE
ncbi:Catechol 2,3-dioxygenase [Ensifer adhaerens]|nr:Catechol 2,3-dioxygenase [Ensifer adhaerens]